LLDCDGPLSEGFVELACRYIREESDGKVGAWPSEVDQWDMMKALNVPKDVAYGFEPNKGAVDFMAALHTWASVYVVTSPLGGPHWVRDRERWLYQWFKVPSRNVVSLHDKFIVHGDAFIDDKMSHLVNWTAEPANKDALAILWRIAPNRHDKWPVEASNYEELTKLLEPLKNSGS
jgi:5'(3')-deoxyribonucleotidase